MTQQANRSSKLRAVGVSRHKRSFEGYLRSYLGVAGTMDLLMGAWSETGVPWGTGLFSPLINGAPDIPGKLIFVLSLPAPGRIQCPNDKDELDTCLWAQNLPAGARSEGGWP